MSIFAIIKAECAQSVERMQAVMSNRGFELAAQYYYYSVTTINSVLAVVRLLLDSSRESHKNKNKRDRMSVIRPNTFAGSMHVVVPREQRACPATNKT